MRKIPPQAIEAWVRARFPECSTRRGGKELVINNPLKHDTGMHFNICPDKCSCHDWRGDDWAGYDHDGRPYGKSFVRFVQLYMKCSWADAVRSIVGATASAYLYDPPKEREAVAPTATAMHLPNGARPLYGSDGIIESMLVRWLASRGVTAAMVERYDIHYCGSNVIWPYYEYGELVYWQSRSRLNKRFTFPSKEACGVGKDNFLYGFDHVEPASYVVVHEAIFDALTVPDQSVACGGATLSVQQLKRIRALGPKDGVVLAPDNDKAGTSSLLKNGKTLLDAGFKVLYSQAPELEYVSDGEVKFTKDWNEVAKCIGFGRPVRELFERRLELLNLSAMVKLRMRAS